MFEERQEGGWSLWSNSFINIGLFTRSEKNPLSHSCSFNYGMMEHCVEIQMVLFDNSN